MAKDVRVQLLERNTGVAEVLEEYYGEIPLMSIDPKLVEKYQLKAGDLTPFSRLLLY